MDNILGQNIRKLRKRKKLTLEQLAVDADTSVGYLHDIENKPKLVNVFLVWRIAKRLKTTVERLLEKPIE